MWPGVPGPTARATNIEELLHDRPTASDQVTGRLAGRFAESEDGRMRVRRGFVIEPGERTLVAEDVVTTGGSARACFDLASELGAETLGVAALVDRSSGVLRAAGPGFSTAGFLATAEHRLPGDNRIRLSFGNGSALVMPASRSNSAARSTA